MIDTGSAVSILSKKIFDKLGLSISQLKGVLNTLTAADGGCIKTYGKTKLSFKLGDTDFDHEVIIADIDELHGILGFDFLEEHDVSISVTKAILTLKGKKKCNISFC